jgi:tRNA U34 5-methylaminomethyl-2-thiouridine-forming methyltransferase MnmC
LVERVAQHQGEFVIWDVGLGAAANALTVLRATRHLSCRIRLLSFDQTMAPLQFALAHADRLGYFGGYEKTVTALADAPDHGLEWVEGQQRVHWEVQVADFPALLTTPTVHDFPKPHAILYDAYSPATNPAMWTQALFSRLFALLDPKRPCALPTYSRSTMLRVTLLLAGFYVGKGHATGEKEETTIAANTLDLISEPLEKRWLSRARNSTSAEPIRDAIYRQAPLSEASWKQLCAHPQFRSL